MRFTILFLRLLSLPITFIGAYTCVILIGFPLIGLAIDINIWADKLEDKLN